MHGQIRAPVLYLPEYLRDEPRRVLAALAPGAAAAGLRCGAAQPGCADLARDPTPNRIRRFGQALVLAAELPPDIGHLHAHFLHTPASVARYAAVMRGLALVGIGPRQGHLDDPGLGKAREARRRRNGR